jgi:aminoacyl-tRNA hydrolase
MAWLNTPLIPYNNGSLKIHPIPPFSGCPNIPQRTPMNIKLIVGLGNPTAEYEHTRHNAGFWFIDELAWQWKAQLKSEKKFHGDIARVAQPQGDVWLLKPDTYMNLSGKAVAALAQFYKIQPEEILVVHDELDIPCGQIRYKLGGGNGGHNGLKDIQAKLGTPNFYRLRLGIGHPGERNLVVGFVLSKPPAAERELIDNAIAKSLQAMPDIMAGDLEKTVRHLHSKSI